MILWPQSEPLSFLVSIVVLILKEDCPRFDQTEPMDLELCFQNDLVSC